LYRYQYTRCVICKPFIMLLYYQDRCSTFSNKIECTGACWWIEYTP